MNHEVYYYELDKSHPAYGEYNVIAECARCGFTHRGTNAEGMFSNIKCVPAARRTEGGGVEVFT